jgi:hypothetical protein
LLKQVTAAVATDDAVAATDRRAQQVRDFFTDAHGAGHSGAPAGSTQVSEQDQSRSATAGSRASSLSRAGRQCER